MGGLPATLLQSLRLALIETNEFSNSAQLSALLKSDNKLRPFRNGLPSSDALDARVDLTIAYLLDRHLVTGENALVSLLQALGQKYDPLDELHTRLSYLSAQLEFVRKLPNSPPLQKLEANLEKSQLLWTIDVENVLRAARSVARVSVPRKRNGEEQGKETGTAWMITPTLAITAWHVISTQQSRYEPVLNTDDFDEQIDNALLTFDFTVHGRGVQYQIENLEYPSVKTQKLDYAILRLKENNDWPLSRRGFLQVSQDPVLTSQTSLYIVQHPLGEPQQISGDVYVGRGSAIGSVLYRTPTAPGTSGAPVFNRETWDVIAIHIGENEMVQLREGILLEAILSEVKDNKPDLYAEIEAVQLKYREEQ